MLLLGMEHRDALEGGIRLELEERRALRLAGAIQGGRHAARARLAYRRK